MRHALVTIAALSLATAARAAPPPADPDWPCQQRLVPHLSFANYWSGPAPASGADWHDNQSVATLAEAVSARDVTPEEGVAKLDAFVHGLPSTERATILPLLFTALVAQTNEQRDAVIARLKELAVRQRALAKRIEDDEAAMQANPADTTGPAADDRAAIAARHELLVRSYHDIGETIRYACQVPSDLDARLGAYARALTGALGTE